jgi:hypothetical protein
MEFIMAVRVEISHWLPIVTFCPVNHLPDLIYVTVAFEGEAFHELYAVRKLIRKTVSGRLCFMEQVATDIQEAFPDAVEVKVRLVTGRHVVTIKGE